MLVCHRRDIGVPAKWISYLHQSDRGRAGPSHSLRWFAQDWGSRIRIRRSIIGIIAAGAAGVTGTGARGLNLYRGERLVLYSTYRFSVLKCMMGPQLRSTQLCTRPTAFSLSLFLFYAV